MSFTSTVRLTRRFNLGNFEHVEGSVEIVVAEGDERAAFGHLAAIMSLENLTTPRAVQITTAPVRAEINATPGAAETVQPPRRGRPPKAKEPAADPQPSADPFGGPAPAAEPQPAPAPEPVVDPFEEAAPAPEPFDPAAATKRLVAACAGDDSKQKALLAWLREEGKQRIRDLTPDRLQACVQAVLG